MGLPKIVLSSNEDPTYFSFVEVVKWAYEKMGFEVHLAILSRNKALDSIKNVRRYEPVGTLPEFSQAKMIRFILASELEGPVYIDDIDLFPLSKKFIMDAVDQRPEGHLLCVGGELYDNNGCYPVSQMTAEGSVWKQFINPNDKTHQELFKEWSSAECMYDRREDMGLKLDWTKDDYFSDERLIRKLTALNPVPKKEIPRGYSDYLDATIDRHTYNKLTKSWDFDRQKLKNHGYVNAHGERPYSDELYKDLIKYINDNY